MRIDFLKGFQAPFTDQSWIVKVLIGTVLLVTSPLVIPTFFFMGYCLSVMRNSANGDEGLPEFQWGAQGMSGVVMFIAILLLNLIPAGLMGFGSFSLIAALLSAGSLSPKVWLATLAGAGALTLGLILLGLFLILIISFFVPALMMRYATSGQIGSLFDFGQAISDIKASPLDYVCIFLLPNILSVAFSILVTVTFGIAGLLMPTFSFLVAVITAKLMGDYHRLCLN
jgi:hypothetical protein